jgi:hypothetical protein
MSRGIRLLALLTLLGGVGCPGAGDDVGLDLCTFSEPAAAQVFVEERYNPLGWSARVEGWVNEWPASVWQTVLFEEGECRYLKLFPGSCDPQCEWGEFCNPDGVCEAYPAGISAGTLTVEGLGAPLVIEEEEFLAGRYYGSDGLPGDLFGAGDPIGASWSGDVFPGVALDARGVAPMDADLAETWLVLVADDPYEVSWTAGEDPAACVELRIHGYNSAHGLPLNDIIWCVGPDDGRITIPASMAALFPLGTCPVVAVDCPPSELTRYTRQTRETAGGDATLMVRSSTRFAWEHLEE